MVLPDLPEKPDKVHNFQEIFAREREIEAILADFDEEWMYELESHEHFDRALNRIKSIPNWQQRDALVSCFKQLHDHQTQMYFSIYSGTYDG